jgi:hypothetical protein
MTARSNAFCGVYLQNDLPKMLQETVERTSMLCEGVKAYVRFAGGE